MMYRDFDRWPDRDLEFIVSVLVPEKQHRGEMIKVLRGDAQILDGMLSDERLFDHLMNDTEQVLNISGRLFFTVLLNKARSDLKRHPFTFEQDNRFGVVVFDAAAVLELLDDRATRAYLATVLSSFVRIESRIAFVRIGNGTFRTMRVNDFDIESLIEFSRIVDDEQRVYLWKRIGEVCLFLIGVFSDYVEAQRQLPGAWYRATSKKELAECGIYYYRAASKEAKNLPGELEHALAQMSENFQLATKPLAYISRRYLGYIEHTVFLQ